MEPLSEAHYSDLIGAPWKLGGDDPADGIDCWELVRVVCARRGLEVPAIEDAAGYLETQAITEAELSGWKRLNPGEEEPGDVALYSVEGRHIDHVGILVAGDRVLQSHRNAGVVTLRRSVLRHKLQGWMRPGPARAGASPFPEATAGDTLSDKASGRFVLRLRGNLFNLDDAEQRVCDWTGGSVRSYLPEQTQARKCVAFVNGGRLSQDALERYHPHPGDMVDVVCGPGVTAAAVAGATGLAAKGVAAAVIAFAINTLISIGLSFIISKLTAPPQPATDEQPIENSPTFSQLGIRNTLSAGGVIPIVFGEHRVGGQIIASFNTVSPLHIVPFPSLTQPGPINPATGLPTPPFWPPGQSYVTTGTGGPWDINQVNISGAGSAGKTTLNLLIAVSEGAVEEINGYAYDTGAFPASSFASGTLYINGSDASTYTDVTVTQRTGTADQPIIPGFNDAVSAVGVERTLRYGQPWTYETTDAVDAFAVQLFVPRGHYRLKLNNGTTRTKVVQFRFRYRPVGDPNWTVDTTVVRDYIHKGSHSWEIRVDDLPRGNYEISLERLTLDDEDVVFASQSDRQEISEHQVNAVNEITYGALSYPGIALVAVQALASDQLSGIPTVTSLVKGKKWWVWDGIDPDNPAFEFKWTQNPGEIIQGLLLDQLRGLGSFLEPADIDWTTAQDVVDYCDEQISDGRSGTMDRCHFDHVYDVGEKAVDLIDKILSAARSSFLPVGGRLGFRIDRARSASHLFSEGNVTDVRIGRVSNDDRPLRINVTFANEEIDYDVDTASVEDEAVTTGAFIEETITARGVTSPARAMRLAQHRLNVSRDVVKTLEFKAPADAVTLQPGDVFWFAHSELSTNHYSGRLAFISAIVGVKLDRDVTVAAGNYKLVYQGTFSGVFELREIAVTYGTPQTIAAGDLIFSGSLVLPGDVPDQAARDCVYAFGPATDYYEPFTCIECPMDGELTRQVRALEYVSTIYDDDPGTVPASTPLFYNRKPFPDPIAAVRVYQEARTQPSGDISCRVAVAWSPAYGFEEADVWYRDAEDATVDGSFGLEPWQLAGRFRGTSALLEDVGVGTLLEVSVVPVSASGHAQGAEYGTRGSVYVAGKLEAPGGVTNLDVKDTPEGCVLSWTPPADPDIAEYRIKATNKGAYWPSGLLVGVAPGSAREFNVGGFPLVGTSNTFMVVPVNTSGIESEDVQSATHTPDCKHEEIVSSSEATGWSGGKTNLTNIGGDLKSDAATTTHSYQTTTVTNPDGDEFCYFAAKLDFDFRYYGSVAWDDAVHPWDSHFCKALTWDNNPFTLYPDSDRDALLCSWDNADFAWSHAVAKQRTWVGLDLDNFFVLELEDQAEVNGVSIGTSAAEPHWYRWRTIDKARLKVTTKVPDGDEYRVVHDSLRLALVRRPRGLLTTRRVTTYDRTSSVAAADETVIGDLDAAAADFTLTLPAAATAGEGKFFEIKAEGAGYTLTVDGSGSETIDGDATRTLTDDEALRLQSDGSSNWRIMP